MSLSCHLSDWTLCFGDIVWQQCVTLLYCYRSVSQCYGCIIVRWSFGQFGGGGDGGGGEHFVARRGWSHIRCLRRHHGRYSANFKPRCHGDGHERRQRDPAAGRRYIPADRRQSTAPVRSCLRNLLLEHNAASPVCHCSHNNVATAACDEQGFMTFLWPSLNFVEVTLMYYLRTHEFSWRWTSQSVAWAVLIWHYVMADGVKWYHCFPLYLTIE